MSLFDEEGEGEELEEEFEDGGVGVFKNHNLLPRELFFNGITEKSREEEQVLYANPNAQSRRIMPYFEFVTMHFLGGIYCIRPLNSRHIKVGQASKLGDRLSSYITCFPQGYDLLWVVGLNKVELNDMEQFAFNTLVANGVERLESIRASRSSEWFVMPEDRKELLGKVYTVPDAMLARSSLQRLNEIDVMARIKKALAREVGVVAQLMGATSKDYKKLLKHARMARVTGEPKTHQQSRQIIAALLDSHKLTKYFGRVMEIVMQPENILMVRHRSVYRRFPGYEGEFVREMRVDETEGQTLRPEDIAEGFRLMNQLMEADPAVLSFEEEHDEKQDENINIRTTRSRQKIKDEESLPKLRRSTRNK